MKLKFTKGQLLSLILFGFMVLAMLGAVIWNVKFPYDTIQGDGDLEFGAMHVIFNLIYVISWIVGLAFLLNNYSEDNFDLFDKYITNGKKNYRVEDETEDATVTKFSFGKFFKWTLIVVLAFYCFKGVKFVSGDMVELYNQSVKYNYNYDQKVQSKAGYYDNMWKSYMQVDKNAYINQETFKEVTKLIMEGRGDGKNVTWKWVKENQQIPYEEFTKFYQQLNDYIIARRDGYYKIEQECQSIANDNNSMLDVFPHNLYNKVLGCKHINFEYGFTSDKTEEVFKTKKENTIL